MEEHQYTTPLPRPVLIPAKKRAQFIIQPFFAVNELLVETPPGAAV